MKISDMSRSKLLEEIQATERKVNSPSWVRNNRRWWVGDGQPPCEVAGRVARQGGRTALPCRLTPRVQLLKKSRTYKKTRSEHHDDAYKNNS